MKRTYEVPVQVSKNVYDVQQFSTLEEAHLFAKLIESEVWECVNDRKDTFSYYKIEDAWAARRIAAEQLLERINDVHASQRTQQITTFVVEAMKSIDVRS